LPVASRSSAALPRRGQMRCANDGRWQFARCFKPTDHPPSARGAALTARHDPGLYDPQADPGETKGVGCGRPSGC
jgi:hypothetical protein